MKEQGKFDSLHAELVHWVDSNCMWGWRSKDEYRDGAMASLQCRTIGWVTFEDKDRLSLSLNESEKSLNDQITIPKRAIVTRRRIRITKKRK